MTTIKLSVSVILLLVGLSSPAIVAQQRWRGKGNIAVKVFFYREPGEYIDLAPVTRRVNASAPARAAIAALLQGPTAAEKRRGFDSLASASDFRIGSLAITGGTARINFISKHNWPGWPGDLAPARFKKAVELTLQQFPTVHSVVVSLNGDEHFDSER